MSHLSGHISITHVNIGIAVLLEELTNTVSGFLMVTEFNALLEVITLLPTGYLKMENAKEDKRLQCRLVNTLRESSN